MDKFPEAFERFEETVDTDRIYTFTQLRLAFSYWAGEKWKDTPRQKQALRIEAERIGIITERKYDHRIYERRYAEPRYVKREYHRIPYIYRGRIPSYIVVPPSWRHEVITVRGNSQQRYRDLKTGRFIRKP